MSRQIIPPKAVKKLLSPSEDDCQKALHKYIKDRYPKVIAWGNTLTGKDYNKKNNFAFEAKMKALGKVTGQPDYYVDEPRAISINGKSLQAHGLRIELKRDVKDSPFYFMPRKKCRKIENDAHLLNQAKYIYDLQQKGYMALFGIGMDQPKDIIDWYMGNKELTFEKFEFNGGKYVPEKYWIWKVKN